MAAKLTGRYGSYEPRTPEEKAKARRQQKARAGLVEAARSFKEKHRWCRNACGKEAAWYEGGQTLRFSGCCSLMDAARDALLKVCGVPAFARGEKG